MNFKACREGFPGRLKSLRKKRHLSKAELARLIQVGDYMVGRYERGEAFPSMDTLFRIRHVFSVDMEYLLCGHDLSDMRLMPFYISKMITEADPDQMLDINSLLLASQNLLKDENDSDGCRFADSQPAYEGGIVEDRLEIRKRKGKDSAGEAADADVYIDMSADGDGRASEDGLSSEEKPLTGDLQGSENESVSDDLHSSDDGPV